MKDLLQFERDYLWTALNDLSHASRVLFAAACAERLQPTLEMICGDARLPDCKMVRSALDSVWRWAETASDSSSTSVRTDELESLIRGDDVDGTDRMLTDPIADNAVAAVVYALRCLNEGDVESAIWAAVQDYEAVDYIAHLSKGISFADLDAELLILSTDCVQVELSSQRADISELRSGLSQELADVDIASSLRSRARADGAELKNYFASMAEHFGTDKMRANNGRANKGRANKGDRSN